MSNYENTKLGAGIKVISILTLIGSVLQFLATLLFIVFKDSIVATVAGIPGAEALTEKLTNLSTIGIIITLILALITIISVSLILRKKAVGVYLYFGIAIINTIYSLITAGFNVNILWSLLFPVLMAVFISQKKELFGFASK